MGILRLDNDIFLMIFDEIGLPEVVNFLRVNRRLHILGHKLLKDHQDLIKRYTTVCINPGSAFDPDFKFSYVSSHPADLLVEVADRPLIASYIRSVTLGELPRSPEMIALRARGAAKLHAHRIFDRLREVGRLYTALSRYQVGVPATAEEAHKLRDEGYDHVQEGEYGGLIKASLCLLLMQLTHLQCLDFCNISSALMSLTFANSVREGSQGYGRQGKCYILSSLPLEKIEFLRDDHQNLRKHPEPKFVTGVAGTLTVRVRSFDKETYSCNWRNILPKLLDTRGGLRELAFRGDYLGIYAIAKMIASAD